MKKEKGVGDIFSVERRELPQSVQERLDLTYSMLGEQEKPKKKILRITGASAAALAACFLILLGMNAAFPAFAESIPGVGGIFKRWNEYTKAPLGSYLETYEGVSEVSVLADAAGESGYTMEVEKVYCEGHTLHFSLALHVPEEAAGKYDYFSGKEFSCRVGEAEADILSFTRFFEDGDAYRATAVARLPEDSSNQEAVEASFSCGAILAHDLTTKMDWETGERLELDFKADFTAVVTTKENRSIELKNPADGSRVAHMEATPSYTKITMLWPQWKSAIGAAREQRPVLLTEDGTKIDFVERVTGEAVTENNGGSTLLFDSLPKGTEKVVLRFMDDMDYTQVLTEATIDLAAGTAMATETYREGGVLDTDSPTNYQFIAWSCGEERKLRERDLVNGLGIEYLRYTKGSGFQLYIGSAGEYRELRAELYTEGGAMIGKTVSQYGTLYENENWYWDESCEYWEDMGRDRPGYRLCFQDENVYEPRWKETLTVKLFENGSGEELLSQKITLTERGFY